MSLGSLAIDKGNATTRGKASGYTVALNNRVPTVVRQAFTTSNSAFTKVSSIFNDEQFLTLAFDLRLHFRISKEEIDFASIKSLFGKFSLILITGYYLRYQIPVLKLRAYHDGIICYVNALNVFNVLQEARYGCSDHVLLRCSDIQRVGRYSLNIFHAFGLTMKNLGAAITIRT